MNRPVQWASASGRPVQWASASGRPVQWASANGRPVQWASVRGRPAQWESSSIVQAQEASRRSWVASGRGKYPVTSFSRPVTSFSSNKTLNGAGSRGQPSSRSRSPHGVSSRSRSPLRAPSRSRPADRGRSPLTSSSRNKTHNGAGSRGQPRKRSPSPQGAVSRSPSPQGTTSRSLFPQGAVSRSPSPQGAISRSPSPQGASRRNLSPQRAPSRSRPANSGKCSLTSSSRNKAHNGAGNREPSSKRSPSPQGAVSRSPSPQGAVSRSPSPQGAVSRILSPQRAPSRSRPANSGKCPLTSSSRNKAHNGAGNREPSSKRSPSPLRVSSRSRSPQWAISRSRPADRGKCNLTSSSRNKPPKRSPSRQGVSSKSGNRRVPSVTIDQNSEDEDGVSATSRGADADPKALSSHEPPDGLYGVKVSNFHFQLKSKHVKSCLTEHFMPYGNVVCVTMHGSDNDRYGLVFYKQKREREKALKADTNGPLERKLCITPWSGPSPCIFGIVVTDINDTSLDVPDRIRYEFSIFGDIALVMMRGLVFQRFVVVFYKDRKGQEKALATKNPFKTSFGEVTLHAWNRPPPSQKEMSNDDILMAVGYSSDVTMLVSK